MTHIAARLKNHLLVRHNPGEGTHPKTERCPNEKVFNDFCVAADGLRRAGLAVPAIREMFPQAYGDDTPRPEPAAPVSPPLEQWLGTVELPGPFFHHAAAKMGRGRPTEHRIRSYLVRLHTVGAHMVGRPMAEITELDAQRYINNLFVCDACKKRAEQAGRDDLLARPDVHLLAIHDPWDGRCEENGVDTHRVSYQRNTILDYRGAMRFVFEIAMWAGSGSRPRDPRCTPVTFNPFEYVEVHDFVEVERPIDSAFALTHDELRRCVLETPDEYRAAIMVATYGTLRRGELLGMARGDLDMPPADDPRGQAKFILKRTFVNGRLKATGKNSHALGQWVILPPTATQMLRLHLDTYRSTPEPDTCPACARGLGEHPDRRKVNPHTGCGFADDAPLWVDPDTGDRPDPGAFARMFRKAVRRAGLADGKYTPGLHCLRATGATLAVLSGQSVDAVVIQGRWSDRRTLIDSYLRPTEDGQRSANDKLDAEIQAAWGAEVDLEAALEEQVRLFRISNNALRAEVEDLKRQLSSAETPAPPRFRSKGWYTEEDLKRELGPAMDMSHLCKRLGLTGAQNTRRAIRRKMDEAGLDFWPEVGPEELSGASGVPDLPADPDTSVPPDNDQGEAAGDEAA